MYKVGISQKTTSALLTITGKRADLTTLKNERKIKHEQENEASDTDLNHVTRLRSVHFHSATDTLYATQCCACQFKVLAHSPVKDFLPTNVGVLELRLCTGFF